MPRIPLANTMVSTSTRRVEIMEAATKLFADQGFHAVGMRAIADEVGIQSSSLYHHFSSKHALLAAIAMEYSHSYIAERVPVLEGDGPADGRLRQVLRDQVVYFWYHRLQQKVGLAGMRDLRETEPAVYDQIQRDLRAYQQGIRRTIEEGVEAKLFETDDPALTARAIVGMIMSVNDWFHEGQGLTIEQVAEDYAELAVDRVLRRR